MTAPRFTDNPVKPVATRESDSARVHLMAGPVLGEAGRAFCGRAVTVRVMWAARAVDKFRESRNAHHNCGRCFAVQS